MHDLIEKLTPWRFTTAIAAMISGVLVQPGSAQIPCHYEVEVLPDINCGFFQAPLPPVAISNTGIVLGSFGSCSSVGDDSAWWNGGPALHILPRPVGVDSIRAWDLSDTGLIVGEARFGTKYKGFVYAISSGQYTFIEPLAPAGDSGVHGINPSGTLICGFRSAISPSVGGLTQAFVKNLETGQVTDLGLYKESSTSAADVNNAGAVTGTLIVSGIPQPFVWQNSRYMPLGTLGSETYPFAIGEHNDVVGWSAQQERPYFSHAFLWRDGVMQDLGVLPGDSRSGAVGLNDARTIVGYSGYSSQTDLNFRGVIWHDGSMRDLNDLVDANVSVGGAAGITNSGMILSDGHVDNQPRTMLLRPQSSAGDVDHNCRVNIDDLVKVITEWGKAKSPADLNNDGIVNIHDLVIVLENWDFASRFSGVIHP